MLVSRVFLVSCCVMSCWWGVFRVVCRVVVLFVVRI